jgi:hypothetical protein
MKKVIWLGVVTLVGACAMGCSSGDSSSPSNGGTTPEPTGSAQGSLYERLGGHDGLTKAVDAIVAEELKDPEIASYFFFQVQNPIASDHPSAAQIKECLVAQLGNAAGGPEMYPMTATGGFRCRSMTAAHAKLSIPGGVFTKFLTIAAGVLKSAGVMDKDIETVGGVLEGTRAQVAQDQTRQSGSFSAPKN